MRITIKEEERLEFLGQIIDVFDDFLERKEIRIPSSDTEMEENNDLEGNTARIYGDDYAEIEEEIGKLLENWSDRGENNERIK